MSKLALLLLACASLLADVRLPALFSDHMLLQRGVPVRVWGKADPGEQVSVRFRDQSRTAQADSLGRWQVHLAPLEAGGPFELAVNTIAIKDVLVGDVWVGSGQSNMVWPVRTSNDADKEIAAAQHPRIRLFKVANKVSDYPLDDVIGSWSPCSPETVRDFSGVGYYFARNLHEKLGVPVAVIQSAWGGTPAEAWTSLAALSSDPGLMPAYAEWAAAIAQYPDASLRYERQLKEAEAGKAKKPAPPMGPGHQWSPAGLYNGMIAPLVPYAIRGVIWYQGESNANRRRAYYYRRLFEAMIRDWRRAWGQGDFPFLFVQLANFKTGPDNRWAELREAQLQTLALHNTGMAVTIDIGDPDNIHPKNKQDVGLRLALAARALEFGEKIEYSGPIFRAAVRDGSALRVWFDHAGGGLVAKGGELKGFTIAGPDRKFVPAQARIEKGALVVWSDDVRQPVAVRYGWADSPECNLYNAEGLPASPFRSDEWSEQ